MPTTLGMLTAFGPLVTDFYLPALPEMGEFFHCSAPEVAMSLTAGMVGLAAGQILIGPLSDKYGRRRLLVSSMALFVIASVLCLFAKSIHVFNLMRVLQGFAGAGGIVLSKSISTDLFSGRDLARFMALLGAINGIAPVFAPILGGAMMSFTTWQGVFVLLLFIGFVLMLCSMRLPETLQSARRIDRISTVYVNLFRVFRNSRFTLSTLAMMMCFFTFFAYITSSSFILQQQYGLSPIAYSLCFGFNAFMIGVGSALSPRFHHANTALKWGAIYLFASTLLASLCIYLHAHLVLLMLCYVGLMLGFGLMQPVSTTIALDAERHNAGAASAIFGASGFVAGALSSPLVSMGRIEVSAGIVMTAGALACLALTLPLCAVVKREAMRGAAAPADAKKA